MIYENVPAGAVRELNGCDYMVGQPIELGDVVTIALADGTFQVVGGHEHGHASGRQRVDEPPELAP